MPTYFPTRRSSDLARVAELHAEAPAIVRKLLQNDFISHIYFAQKFALFIGIGRPLRKSWKFRTVCPPVTSLMHSVRAFLASTANRRPTNSRDVSIWTILIANSLELYQKTILGSP